MSQQFTAEEYKFIGLYVLTHWGGTANFAETDSTKITDPQLLLQLRDILQSQYQDGITAIPEARLNSDDSFSGIFEDEVNPKLIKRFNFTISADDTIAYKLLNPADVENFTEELEFAAAATKKKKKNCTKGVNCGGSCISATKTCRKTVDAGTKKKTAELRKKLKGGVAPKTQDEINFKIDKSNYQELIDLGRKFSDKYLKEIPISQKQSKLSSDLERLKQELAKSVSPELIKKFRLTEDRYYLEKSKQEFEQFNSFRNAIVKKHAVDEKLAQAWVDNLVVDQTLQGKKEDLKITKDGLKELFLLSGGKNSVTLTSLELTRERAFANYSRGVINVGAETDKKTIFHEGAHHIEFDSNDLRIAAREFIESRATSKTPERLRDLTGNNDYQEDEVALPDKFIDAYVGKIYGDKGAPTEVVSMGVENFISASKMQHFYKQDPEHFHFTLGVLLSEN